MNRLVRLRLDEPFYYRIICLNQDAQNSPFSAGLKRYDRLSVISNNKFCSPFAVCLNAEATNLC